MKYLSLPVLILLAVFLTVLPGYGQQYNPYQQQAPYRQQAPQYNPYQNYTTDQLLTLQDQMMIQQMVMRYPMDYRYNNVLNAIMGRFNNAGRNVFRNFDAKDVNFIVLANPFGFNACAFHNSIVLDSLLMDTFKNLADGMAKYGTIDNDYVIGLAARSAQLHVAALQGRVIYSPQNMANPYNLPSCGPLTPQQQQKSLRYFEEMTAAILAHEASHAFLEHTKEKMLTQQKLILENQDKNPQLVQMEVQKYMNQQFSHQKELEADAYGAKFVKASGYTKYGFLYWLKFAEIFEKTLGLPQSGPSRTHPTSQTRIDSINRMWDSL